MPYTYVTLETALDDLSRRLYDPNNLFWTDAEKTLYIQEALRTWNSHTNYWREEFTFPTVSGTYWYDITDTTPAPNTLRPMTLTDVDLYTIIQYSLLEPPTGATWSGTAQFGIQQLLDAVGSRINQILGETGCTTVRSTVTADAASKEVADNVLDIRRIGWLPDTTYPNSPLWEDDNWGLQAFQRGHQAVPSGVPDIFTRSTEPPLTFDANKTPAVTGNYELVTVNSISALSTGSPTTLNIPDDFAWVARWGAIADLLSRDSLAKDPLRAAYAELRYNQGVALLQRASAVLELRIGTTTLDIDSVTNADRFRNNWQWDSLQDQPDTGLIAGLNLLAFTPGPDAAYTITVTCVENAPVPPGSDPPNENIEIGRDDFDSIMDYAQHLAMFKMGGGEFIGSKDLFERFIGDATVYNRELGEMGEFKQDIFEQSQYEEETNPRMTPEQGG